MDKKVLVLLAEGFEEIEAVTSIDLLRRAGAEVVVAGLDHGPITGARGIAMHADTHVGDVEYSDFDALVLPGGMPGSKNLAESVDVDAIVKYMYHKEKLIAAICAAPALVLASKGVLDNKNATCYPGSELDFKDSTTHLEDGVVVDGNIITSQGVGTAIDFSLAIIGKLYGKTTADSVAKRIVYA